MGDRGNIVLKLEAHHKPEQYLYLYTHWSGSRILETLQKALVRGRSRWDDPSYLARIIFCELIGANNWESLTGFGLHVGQAGDNEHLFILVDMEARTVEMGKTRLTFEQLETPNINYQDVQKDIEGPDWRKNLE